MGVADRDRSGERLSLAGDCSNVQVMEARTVTRSAAAVAAPTPVVASAVTSVVTPGVAPSVVPSVAPAILPTAVPAAVGAAVRADEAVNPAIRELLVIFAEALAGVSFPDVDGKALAVQAAQVEERAVELRRLEATLDEARRRLAEAQDALAQRALRAVAYARVFADGDAALSARLEALVLPRPRSTRAVTAAAVTPDGGPRRRGRPPRAASPVLFDERAPVTSS